MSATRIREATAADRAALERAALPAAQRALLVDAFGARRASDSIVLVAEADGAIVGQLWIDLAKRAEFSAGVLWALYIAPEMRGQGIGSQLLASAEERLRERRYEFAEIGAERDNPAARRLYERLGYRLVCEDIAEYAVTAPDGTPGHVTVDQWVLSKKLMR